MGLFSSIISGVSSLAGGLIGQKAQSDNVSKNIAQQTRFAKNGIQWKVADAKKAGIHPLYALGSNTHSFSPVSISGSPLGEAVANMGQDLGRAAQSFSGRKQRALIQQGANLDIRRKQLENELLETQIQNSKAVIANQPGTPPAVDVSQGTKGPKDLLPGQPISHQSKLTQTTPTELKTVMPGKPSTQTGAIPDSQFIQVGPNEYSRVMSEQTKERLEEDWLGTFSYNVRNRLKPALGFDVQRLAPPKRWLPKGYSHWGYNPFTEKYYPARKKGWFITNF